MKPEIAAVCFACGILGLFLLDRDPKARFSFALWIPVIWLSIAGSRVVSEWLNPSGPSLANPYVEGNAVDRNVQTVLLVLALIVLLNRGGKVGRLLRANGPILVFFLYCGVSALWSDFPDVSFRRWIKAIGDLVMVLVVLTDPDRSAAFKIPARVGFLLIPLSILLMRYYPYLARGFDDITGVPTYTGVTTSKNSLGMICMVFGLGSVWRFLEAYRSRERTRRTQKLIAHGAVIAMVLWLLLGAHSMTSLSCFALAIGLMLATSSPTLARKPSVVHLLVAAVVCVSFSVLFLNVGGSVLETIGRDPSLTGRTAIWHMVLGISRNPLLGTGFESFWLGDRLQKMWSSYRGINQAHNGYIEIYLNLGWVGLCLLGVVLVTSYRRIVGALRRDPTASFLLAYFVVGVVYNFTEAAFKTMSPLWITFLLAIVAVPTLSRRRVPVRVGIDHADKFQLDRVLHQEGV